MCDTFCLRRPDGMVFAKSSDRPIDEAQVVELLGRRDGSGQLRATHVTVPDAPSALVVGSRPTWMWGLEHGVNEHRVAVGNEKVWTIDDPRAVPPALLGMDLVRLALERSRSADEALDVLVDLLGGPGQGGSGEEHADEPYWSSFLVVDQHGGWVVETSGRTWVAQPVGDGAAISNRLTLRRAWTRSSPDVVVGADWDAWRDPEAPTGLADHRLAATTACVARGGGAVSPAQAIATLRDHGTGPWGAPDGTGAQEPVPAPAGIDADWRGVTVCLHARGYQATTASMVADLPADAAAPVRAWASLGTACTGAFLPVALLGTTAVVPAVLSDPAAWDRFRHLSRCVEAADPDGVEALRSVRRTLGPLEASAWAEADELWHAGADAVRWQAAADAWSHQLRSALAELAPI